jgi:PAS domain-containing protein
MNGQTEMKARIRELEDALRRARSSEAEARETLARYRVVADNLTDIVWTLDADLKTTFVTPSVEGHLGYAIQETVGLDFCDTLTLSSQEQLRYAIKKDINDRARMVRQFKYENGMLDDETTEAWSSQTYFDNQTMTALSGPFSFMHSQQQQH